jgi:class 3 adenylate cyclase
MAGNDLEGQGGADPRGRCEDVQGQHQLIDAHPRNRNRRGPTPPVTRQGLADLVHHLSTPSPTSNAFLRNSAGASLVRVYLIEPSGWRRGTDVEVRFRQRCGTGLVTASSPETRYVKNGDVNIAYQVSGSGPVDLVYAGDFAGHLELDWENAQASAALRRLGAFARLIRMNRRGQGLSDRRVPPTAIEDEIGDLRAVMDAVSSVQPFIFGTGEGAVRAAVFAATYPTRVAGLILYAGYAKPSSSDDYPHANPPEFMEALIASVEQSWGREFGMQIATPTAAADAELSVYFARLQRASLGPGDALAMIRFTNQLDIRAVLPSIDTPTLVLHRIGDRLIPVAQSRYLAEHISGARLVEFPGADNAMWIGDSIPILDEIEEFVTGTRPASTTNRALTTVVFTDIVGSTDHAASVGDAKWSELLAEHDRVLAELVAQFGGRVVKSTGDGMLATFDGPARATRCAAASIIRVHDFGIEIRAGLHTGEVELLGDDVSGVAVHIAARVAALAAANEALVTGTVRDLVVGSGIDFDDRGLRHLRGVPDQWRILAVTTA